MDTEPALPPRNPSIPPTSPRTLAERCQSLSADFQALLKTDLRNDSESSLFAKTKLHVVASQLEDLRFRFEIWISDIGGIDSGILSENDELTNSTAYSVIVTSFDRIESELTSVRSTIRSKMEKTSSRSFSKIRLVRPDLWSKSTQAFNRIRDSCDTIKSSLHNLTDIVVPLQMLHAIQSSEGPFVEFQNHLTSIGRRVDASPPVSAGEEENLRRQSSKLDKAPKGQNSVQYEDEHEKSNAALHLAWNTLMAQGSYKYPSFYQKVKCLLVSWDKECDDLNTEEEVASLAKVFETRFHFKVKRALLTNNDEHLPHVQVLKYIIDFIWAEDGVHTLLLFYYAGHGSPRPFGDGSTGLALSGKFTHYDNAENLTEVVWAHLEDNFQHTKADVLEIFDCCYTGDLGRTRQPWGTRSFEFLSACSSGNTTLSPGKGSFTAALIWALEALVKAQTRFTLSELCCKIREAPDFPPDQIPIQYDRGVHTFERIIIAPLPETGDHESSVSESVHDSVPQGLLHLNVLFEKPPSQETIEKFAMGMNRLVYQQGLPVNRIVWGGLVLKFEDQSSPAGQGQNKPSMSVQRINQSGIQSSKA